MRVIENQRFSADTEIKQHGGFEYDCRVYWNSSLEEYVPYTYTDRVTHDISLYQTYKEKTISVIDEEGAALESVSVKPYTQYSLITAPQKQGYDFLGFRVEGGGGRGRLVFCRHNGQHHFELSFSGGRYRRAYRGVCAQEILSIRERRRQ